MINFKTIWEGLKIRAKAVLTSDEVGEIEVSSVDNKTYLHNGSTRSPVVTEAHTATLTNKTIDANGTGNSISNLETADLAAGVLNTSTTLAGATNTQIPSALAIKTYVDNKAAAQDQASEISFAPTGTIAATNVQAMGAELDGDIQTHIASTIAHGATGAVVGTTNTQTLINKTLDNSSVITVRDANLTIQDDIDVTKQVKIQASGVATATTRTLSVPNADGTIVLDNNTQTLSNKTLDNTSVVTVKDTNFTIQDDIDVTKQVKIQASGLATATTRTLSVPNADGTLVLDNNIQTITNKTVVAASNTITTAASGNLTATELNAALAELQGDIDTRATSAALTSHTGASTGVHGVTGAVVGTTDTQTLSSKSLVDASTSIVDSVDASKKIIFDAAGATATSTTLLSSQTVNRTITLPDATDTLVGKATTDTLTNKTLTSPVINTPTGIVKADVGLGNVDNTSDATKNAAVATLTNKSLVDASTSIVDSVDATKKIIFDAAGTTATTTTILSSQTVNRTLTLPDATDTIVGRATTDTLTNKTLTGANIQDPTRLDVKKDTLSNLTTYAATATNGQIVFATDVKEMYQIVDNALVAVGSGGGTGIGVNQIAVQTFDDAVVGDFTQTGLELVTSSTIHGGQTARLIHQASSNYSFKQLIDVDRKFRGKSNTLSLSGYSTASSSNVTILVTDETNSATLLSSTFTTGQITAAVFNTASSTTVTVTDNSILNQLSVGARISGAGIPTGTTITAVNSTAGTITISNAATATATGVSLKVSALPNVQSYAFDIPTNCSSISYTVTALQEAGLPETYVDDIIIELTQQALQSAAITTTTFNASDWTSYTPTFTGFGTPTGVEFEWRQVGANYEIRGKATTGTVTATEARISLPNSATSAGVSIIPSISKIGDVAYGAPSSGADAVGSTFSVLIEPSVNYITFSYRNNTTGGLTKLNGTAFGNTATFSFIASVPIAGLTANTTTTNTIPLSSSVIVTEPDSYLRMTNITGSAGVLDFTNVTSMGDAVSKVGNTYVINKSGIYDIGITTTMAGADNRILITKNSTTTTNTDPAVLQWGSTHTTGGYEAKANWSGYLEKDSVIRFTSPATPSASNSNQMAYISYQGSTKILNPSSDQKVEIPTHELRFEGASARGSVATAIVKFDTLAKIKGDGFEVINTADDGTVVTIKKSGRLQVSCSLTGNAQTFQITKNQVTLTARSSTASEILAIQSIDTSGNHASASATVDVVVGDKIRVNSDQAATANASNNFTLSLQEKSVAVALQNVAPRWDDSDSAVRVRTGNGFGSTNTQVRRFSSVVDNLGTDIDFVDSATLGSYFLIKADGLYSISYTDEVNTATSIVISKGVSTATNGPNILAVQTMGASSQGCAAAEIKLLKGDIIYPVVGSPANVLSSAINATFMISKVGKTQGTVDVTPFVQIPQNEIEAMESSQAVAVAANTTVLWNLTKNTNKGIISYNTSTGEFTALKECKIDVSFSANATNAASITPVIRKNGVDLPASTTVASIGNWAHVSASLIINTGDKITCYINSNPSSNQRLSLTANAISPSIATPTEQVSSDTIPFVFKDTAITDSDPVGTFNTYTYAANTNTATISATAPTQSTSSMNINGIQVFGRAYNATSTSAQPARVDIKIGKGLKSKEVLAYAGAAKTNPVSFDHWTYGTTVELGAPALYNEVTGVLSIESAVAYSSSVTNRFIGFDLNGTGQTSAYFVFNASKSPSLVSIPNLQQRVAYLSDVKPNGTAGGSSVAGQQTRTLNTIVDNTGIVTSLASNQFTLPAGTYQIEASAPTYSSNNHKIRIRNITDSTTSLIGSSSYTTSAYGVENKSTLSGEITITSPKVFELQHHITAATASNGLGTNASSGENEVYAQVKITKIK